ncbi:MAG: hydantoinase/oxoprolinase family protein [Geminicoccaceae bacterium]
MSGLIVGIDVGGTFTDVIALDPDLPDSPPLVAKVPSTPDNQAFGVLAGLAAVGVPLERIALLVHGTTATTNALLERRVARAGLITTAGFRDVLELGRRTRPQPYGMTGRFEPLIARELRLEVPERLDYRGRVLVPLDEAAVAGAALALRDAGCESVAIHFLHAYANPAHERRAGEIVRAVWPEAQVTLGHALLSEYREFERGTTAAVNASVQPILERYLGRLQAELKARGFARDLLVMQGNGGIVAASGVAREAARTVMSGPASGVMAAAWTASRAGFGRVVTYDMGGTSTDVALIRDGVPAVSAELELEYAMPIHLPMVDVHSIGAGGGSIAHVDDGGFLRVGPRSAGAMPGPICYGRGGTEPTITDANLLLGRLDAGRLIAVGRSVDLAEVERQIAERIGRPLGLPADEAATAILRIANDRMAGAIRMVSLARGEDPRDFCLFAFGGAGPLHATALARELGIPTVLVPARPGLGNALGCLVADARQDAVRTLNRPLEQVEPAEVAAILAEQAAAGRALVAGQRIAVEDFQVLHAADMQFRGQTHLLHVPLDAADLSLASLRRAFEAAYLHRFGIELPEIGAVLVNLKTSVIGRRRTFPPRRLASLAQAGAGPVGERPVRFAGRWLPTPVWRREVLAPGMVVEGPALVEQMDTTTVIEPGDRAETDSHGNLLIRVAALQP